MKRRCAVLCILAGTVGDRVYRRTERNIWQEVLYEENSGGKLKMAAD